MQRKTQTISMELDVPHDFYLISLLRVYESHEKLIAIFNLTSLAGCLIDNEQPVTSNKKAGFETEVEVQQAGFFAKPVEYYLWAEGEEIKQIAEENQKKCKFTIIDELPNFKNTNMTKIFDGEASPQAGCDFQLGSPTSPQ